MNREQYISILEVDIAKLKKDKRSLIKYIEDKITKCKNTLELLDDTGSFRISILQVQINNYKNLLERIKSGKYE